MPSTRRVLVADPCPDTVESTVWLLRLWGHEVRGAQSGPKVLEAVRSYHPDTVLLEIGLPEIDGYEVVRRLRQHEGVPHLLLVAVTGYGSDQFRRRAWDVGFDQFLVKPADPELLRELLATTPVGSPMLGDLIRPDLADVPGRQRCTSKTRLGRRTRNSNGLLKER
jgi:CheY-like chemotaxis protein